MNIKFFSQIEVQKLFSRNYLFEKMPSPEGLYRNLSFLFGAFIIASLILMIKAKQKNEIFKNFYAKIINLLLFGGFGGLILIFCRYEGIPYLGSRLFLLILIFILIIWSSIIAWYRLRILPQKVKEDQKRQAFEKYLP